jgi:hypothetical protein
MKNSLLLMSVALFILTSIFCSEAPIVEEEPTGRIVLAELFTYARCVFCPFAEHALDSLSQEYGDSLAVIAYHRRQLGDTLSPVSVAVRESLYQITTSPAVVFDGLDLVQTEDPDANYSVYKGWIVNERNRTPLLRLGIDASVDAGAINLTLHVVSLDSIETGDYHYFFAVYEDSVYFAQSGAPESTFYYVVREMAPDAYGASIGISYPDSTAYSESIVLKSSWDVDKLGVVAFVQDMASHEVLQAIVVKRLTD